MRTQLGEADFLAAFTEGAHLTVTQALDARGPIKLVHEENVHKHTQKEIDQESNTTRKGINRGDSAHFETLSAVDRRLPSGEHLTPRETDVLYLLAQGQANAEIAENLTLSRVTVNSYLRSIYSKFGVSSRTAAVRYAFDHRLV